MQMGYNCVASAPNARCKGAKYACSGLHGNRLCIIEALERDPNGVPAWSDSMKPVTAKFDTTDGGFATDPILLLVLITDHKGAA